MKYFLRIISIIVLLAISSFFQSQLISQSKTILTVDTLRHIAIWNGNTWTSMSGGLDNWYNTGVVNGLTIYNNNVIAIGDFTHSGGTTLNDIAKWNGNTWQQLGTGLLAYGYSLTIYNSNLVAGGYQQPPVVKWNDTAWSSFGIEYPSGCNALGVYNNQLIEGVGPGGSYHICNYDGNNWNWFNPNLNNQVYALAVYNGILIAGGSFDHSGTTTISFIAQWNGTNWSAPGGGMNNQVRALCLYKGNLVAGGIFTTAGGTIVNYVAQWNGTTWLPFGSGTDNDVYALAV